MLYQLMSLFLKLDIMYIKCGYIYVNIYNYVRYRFLVQFYDFIILKYLYINYININILHKYFNKQWL